MTDTNAASKSQIQDIPKTPAQEQYPDRYYAQYDPKASQPAPVLGWYDMWGYLSLEGLPPLSELLPLSEVFWSKHIMQPQESRGVLEGKIVDYTPPSYIPTLKDQAQKSLQAAQQQASMVSAMGETFGSKTRAYVQALRAIINGSDTTSTVLPTAPSDPTQ